MKSIVYVVLFLVLVFVSCQKDEVIIPVNNQAIKAELAAMPSPEKQEFIEVVSSKTAMKLKSGSTVSLVQVFPLAEETYEVYEDHAIKKFAYYDLNGSSELAEKLTMFQRFEIVNGKLDTSGYGIEYAFGCEDAQKCVIDVSQDTWITEAVYLFHFNNKSQFAYRMVEGNLSEPKLPKIANGYWEVVVSTYDGELNRRLTTGAIEFSGEDVQVLTLKPQPKEVNVVAQLKVKKELLQGVYYITLWGTDEQTGDVIQMSIPFYYSEELPSAVFFNLPFHPESVTLIYRDELKDFELNRTEKDGKTIYTFHD